MIFTELNELIKLNFTGLNDLMIQAVLHVSYVIVLTENEVYAWGNNAMGQCGQGHCQSPITRPKLIFGLEGVTVHQISAGTSHSAAWSALPTDR